MTNVLRAATETAGRTVRDGRREEAPPRRGTARMIVSIAELLILGIAVTGKPGLEVAPPSVHDARDPVIESEGRPEQL